MTAGLLVYGVVAALCLVQTLSEGARKRLPWSGYRVLGVVLSLAWPVLVVIALVAALRRQRWGDEPE